MQVAVARGLVGLNVVGEGKKQNIFSSPSFTGLLPFKGEIKSEWLNSRDPENKEIYLAVSIDPLKQNKSGIPH